MTNNFKVLDTNNILHKEGIIINLQTLNIIYPKSNKNIIRFNNENYNMGFLMLKVFYNIDDADPTNCCHIDDNVFNNNINNLIYLNNNREKINKYQNLYLNNNECYYYLIIEKYNLNFDLINIIPNIKYYNFDKNFLLNLFTYSYICDKTYYWKININKIYNSEIYNKNLYNRIENTNYYISSNKSHVIDKIKKKILPIFKKLSGEYYSTLYDSKYSKYNLLILEYYNFLILDSLIFNNDPNF